MLEDGKIYPLTVGKIWSYRHTGGNVDGRTWETIRKCAVETQAEVTTTLGTFDTYKVVCDDDWSTRTWYLSPEYGRSVKYIRYTKNDNSTKIYETVSYVLR